MDTELRIDEEAVVKTVYRDYGFCIEHLTLLPQGEVAHNFSAAGTNGTRYLLKLLGPSRAARRSAARLDFYLPLMEQLHAKGICSLPCPIRTKQGDFYTHVDGWPLVVFPFIEGRTLEGQWPYSEPTRTAIAQALAMIHKSTSQLDLAMGFPREDFGIPFEKELIQGLQALEAVSRRDRKGQYELKGLLLPHREAILGHLDHLQELQGLARSATRNREFVLCHTDPTPFNLLLTDEGELYVLDWEDAKLAPPEHDLFFFTGEGFPRFLAEYERAFGPIELDGGVFGFYFYRRYLEDLTAWIVRILYENTNDEQDAHDLEGIREDCLGWWPHLEGAIRLVKRQLLER
jgi:Ser/Thr protein kinase RdoA (MazF antagonist)